MGTLNVNLIADNGGGSNVNMQCEGSNTSNLAQGLAKAYFCHTTDSQIEASFNVASVADNQAGDFSVNLTNAYQSADYCVHYTLGVTGGARVCPMYEHDQRVTSRTDLFSFNHNGNALIDPNGSMYSSYGDLA